MSNEPEKLQKLLEDFLAKNKPYLIKLEEEIRECGSGVVKVELRVFEGFVTDLVTTKVKRHVFKQKT